MSQAGGEHQFAEAHATGKEQDGSPINARGIPPFQGEGFPTGISGQEKQRRSSQKADDAFWGMGIDPDVGGAV